MKFSVLALLFLMGCSSLPNGITCTYREGKITCGSSDKAVDHLAQGADDEKPRRSPT